MFDDLAVDQKDLQIKLQPAVRAIFEPVSGVMVMNVTDPEFEAMRQEAGNLLAGVFAHEMYHCFQAYTSGYQYAQICRLRDALFDGFKSQTLYRKIGRYFQNKLYTALTAVLPQGIRFSLRAQHFAKTAIRDHEDLHELAQLGQPSMVGAQFAGLYTALSKLKQQTTLPGKDGLSANDLLECSAEVYGKFSTKTTTLKTKQLLEELGPLGDTYVRALRVTADLCGERAIRIILPGAALALRYEHPENAYVELVRRIAESLEDGELAAAKKLAGDLPHIEQAGKILGTAVKVRANMRRPTKIYDRQMEALKSASWGIDELDLLTDANAIGAIPPGSLGFGIRTRDSARGFTDNRGMLVIAAIMLRGGPSIHHMQSELDDSMKDFAAQLLISADSV